MYTVVVKNLDGNLTTFKTDKRTIARAVKLGCQENGFECHVTVEQKRDVKFKGIVSDELAGTVPETPSPSDKKSGGK